MWFILAFGGIGYQEIIVVLIIIVVLFGATKLPKLGSAVGETIKNLKRGMREVKEEEAEAQKKEEQKKLEAEKEPEKSAETSESSEKKD